MADISAEIPAELIVFDVLLWDGVPVHERPLEERRARVEALDGFRISPATRDRAQAAAARAEAAFAEVRSLEERIHAAEKDLVALRHDLASADEEMARLQRKATVLDTERGFAGAVPDDHHDDFEAGTELAVQGRSLWVLRRVAP